ncbi:MAG: DUF4340 domain-containing protein [bacterium]
MPNSSINIKNREKLDIEKNKENKWLIAGAEEKSLNQDVQNIINELGNISVEEFVGKGPSSLKDYGLADPFYSITVDIDQGETVSLSFGKIENNLVYTMKNREKMFYRVRRNIIDNLENLYVNKEKKDAAAAKKK